MVKKVELHNHLEGTAPPKLIQKIGARNGFELPQGIVSEDGKNFIWNDFLQFLDAYEQASQVIKLPIDYFDITYEYLKQFALEDCLYVEMMYSPEHAERASGLPSKEHLIAVCDAIDKAKSDFGIIGRIIYVAVRHYGTEACENVAKLAHQEPHQYVVGYGLAGDEKGYPPAQFKRAFEIAKDANLGCTVHAGEMDGPDSIIEALDNLDVSRIGHGVRAIEDPNLMSRIKDENIHLEVCPSSNIALDVFPSYEAHPLRKLYEFGLSLSLNSDDPPYFHCTVGGEYDIAQQKFGFTEEELTNISNMAIDAAFVDSETKQLLKKKLDEN